MVKLKCLLISSRDSDWLSEFAINAIAKELEIIKVLKFNRDSPSIDSMRSELQALPDFDYLINFLSPKKIPEWMLAKSAIAAINFHPGSNDYPGVGSASLSIYDQRELFGVTAHLMNNKIDSGQIIAQRFFKQEENITCEELFTRALKECCKLLTDVLELIKKGQTFKEVARWTRSPVSRNEFNNWLVISSLPPSKEVDRKVQAARHNAFPGPYVKIGTHLFSYFSTEAEE